MSRKKVAIYILQCYSMNLKKKSLKMSALCLSSCVNVLLRAEHPPKLPFFLSWTPLHWHNLFTFSDYMHACHLMNLGQNGQSQLSTHHPMPFSPSPHGICKRKGRDGVFSWPEHLILHANSMPLESVCMLAGPQLHATCACCFSSL